MYEHEKTQQKEAVAAAKERCGGGTSSSLPKRFNPLDLLAETSIPCLTRIAENASIPPTMLEQLALHEHAAVREAVADNMNTPIDTLWVLAADECVDVRYAIAENHNVPLAILTKLLSDENPYVAARAGSTLNRLTGAIVLTADFTDRGGGRAVKVM